MNEKKHELLQAIADRLNEKGWTDILEGKPFSPDYGTVKSLGFLPEKNLNKILEQEFTGNSADHWYYKMKGQGLFKMLPYLTNEDGMPVLVLVHDKLMVLNKTAGCFQIWGEIPCKNKLYAGNFSLSTLLKYSAENQICKKSFLSYVLWYAALIEVGARHEEFIELYNADIGLLEKFLCDSIQAAGGYTYSNNIDLNQYVKTEPGHIETGIRPTIQIINKQKIIAYLAVGETSIQVETSDGLRTTLIIPSMVDGTGMLPSINKPSIQEALKIYQQIDYIKLLTVLTMFKAGLRVTHNCVSYYNRDNLGDMPSLIHNIERISDLQNIQIDRF